MNHRLENRLRLLSAPFSPTVPMPLDDDESSSVRARCGAQATRHLEDALQHTRASVSLRVDALHETHLRHWRRLLRRLARHGDRVEIVLSEALGPRAQVDSSVFRLRFEG